MAIDLGIVVLAAGEGTRLKLDVPKALAPLKNRVLVDYVLNSAMDFSRAKNLQSKIAVVTGHRHEEVEAHIRAHGPEVNFCYQEVRRGTGDAIKSYFAKCPWGTEPEYTLVLCADTPMIGKEELGALYESLIAHAADAVCASFRCDNPHGYGRIKRATKGFTIVEQKDASVEEAKINEVNSGLYIFKTSLLKERVSGLTNNNKSGEFYLTDVFAAGANVIAHCFERAEVFGGVNTLAQLAEMEGLVNEKLVNSLLDKGVRVINPQTLLIDPTVEVEAGAIIGHYVELRGNSKICAGAKLESQVIIEDSTVHSGAQIKSYSYLENAIVGANAAIGPYARLRPGADIGEESKIGNFVEIKKAKLHKGVKVSHLSYVGDAEIGDETNIGCGFITCNYDGKNKHKTDIGKNCFIGSDTQIVAPLTIGDGSYVASGSTINQNMPAGSFAIARAKQVTKEGMAGRFLKK